MRAYIRAARDDNDALRDGKLDGSGADEIISILTESTLLKDPAVYRATTPHGGNSDGKVHEARLKNDFRFFKGEGLIEGNVGVEQVIDSPIAEVALKNLGTYRPLTERNQHEFRWREKLMGDQ